MAEKSESRPENQENMAPAKLWVSEDSHGDIDEIISDEEMKKLEQMEKENQGSAGFKPNMQWYTVESGDKYHDYDYLLKRMENVERERKEKVELRKKEQGKK